MTHSANETRQRCRACGGPLDHVFADLGAMPLANHNLKPGQEAFERSYPLIARICSDCLLVQVDDSVPPGEIFSDYDYFSSYSPAWVEHARKYADAMTTRFKLGAASRVVEIASNDGYLLQHFTARGIPVTGVDPAVNVAACAVAKGIPTEVAFFDKTSANDMLTRGLAADLMAANNVLAHVPGINEFVRGFSILLKPEGVATFEFPHIMRQIEQMQFDTIYHEHFSYLSVFTVDQVLARAGLRAFDVEELPTHGGSLRLYVCRQTAAHDETAALARMRAAEKQSGLTVIDGYLGFANRIAAIKGSFLAFLDNAKRDGKRVAAYGAAAKGNTFLNYCGVRYPDIFTIYDRSHAKQGKRTPGSHIPIKSPDEIVDDQPDFVVILPWNLADEIRQSMRGIEDWGGRFVTAIPESRII